MNQLLLACLRQERFIRGLQKYDWARLCSRTRSVLILFWGSSWRHLMSENRLHINKIAGLISVLQTVQGGHKTRNDNLMTTLELRKRYLTKETLCSALCSCTSVFSSSVRLTKKILSRDAWMNFWSPSRLVSLFCRFHLYLIIKCKSQTATLWDL